ncbi:MAG: Rid family detoxifying hydrolase [Oscillospiraceae bacterium]|nr:Rid family detoxifying hydrolase [Oscillospiraceae bacterium]
MKKVIPVPDAPKPKGQYSHAVQAGNLLYTAGQIPLDPATDKLVDGGIEAQTRQVMCNLKTVLNAAGADFPNVVKAHVYVDDIANMPVVNSVYAEYFPTDPPARTSVQVAALPMGALVEIGLIAIVQ